MALIDHFQFIKRPDPFGSRLRILLCHGCLLRWSLQIQAEAAHTTDHFKAAASAALRERNFHLEGLGDETKHSKHYLCTDSKMSKFE